MKTLVFLLVLVFCSAPAMAWEDDDSKSIYEIYQDERQQEVQENILWEQEKQTFEMQQERQRDLQREYEQRKRESDRELRDLYKTDFK
jgi:hypothetical protein